MASCEANDPKRWSIFDFNFNRLIFYFAVTAARLTTALSAVVLFTTKVSCFSLFLSTVEVSLHSMPLFCW